MSKETTSFFSNKGRLTQSDFALKTAFYSEPIIAMKTKKSVYILSKQNERMEDKALPLKSKIFIIDKSLGIGGCGLKTDFKIVLKRARKIAKNFSYVYGKSISANILTNELSTFFQEFTYSSGTRPFGLCIFIIGFSNEGPELFQINPDGNIFCIKANMIGKKANQGLQFLNKRWNINLNHEESILTCFLSLKEISDGQLKHSDVNVAFIDQVGVFRILNKIEIKKLFSDLEETT
jgi:20S proteasome subunit alpha 2